MITKVACLSDDPRQTCLDSNYELKTMKRVPNVVVCFFVELLFHIFSLDQDFSDCSFAASVLVALTCYAVPVEYQSFFSTISYQKGPEKVCSFVRPNRSDLVEKNRGVLKMENESPEE